MLLFPQIFCEAGAQSMISFSVCLINLNLYNGGVTDPSRTGKKLFGSNLCFSHPQIVGPSKFFLFTACRRNSNTKQEDLEESFNWLILIPCHLRVKSQRECFFYFYTFELKLLYFFGLYGALKIFRYFFKSTRCLITQCTLYNNIDPAWVQQTVEAHTLVPHSAHQLIISLYGYHS